MIGAGNANQGATSVVAAASEHDAKCHAEEWLMCAAGSGGKDHGSSPDSTLCQPCQGRSISRAPSLRTSRVTLTQVSMLTTYACRLAHHYPIPLAKAGVTSRSKRGSRSNVHRLSACHRPFPTSRTHDSLAYRLTDFGQKHEPGLEGRARAGRGRDGTLSRSLGSGRASRCRGRRSLLVSTSPPAGWIHALTRSPPARSDRQWPHRWPHRSICAVIHRNSRVGRGEELESMCLVGRAG